MKQKSHDKYTYPTQSRTNYRNLKRGECHAIFGVSNQEKSGLKSQRMELNLKKQRLNWLKLVKKKNKKFNKNMTYTFNKENFKNHLRNNATRSWFSKSYSNIRYRSDGEVEEYGSRNDLGCNSVKVNEVLCEPSQPDRTAEKVGAVAGMTAGATGIGLATCLAPFTFGGSILAAGVAGAGFLGSAAALDYSSRTEKGKVYFTLAGDNSEWVAETSEFYGVSSIAYHIYWWSDSVYEEKFKTHAYQAQPPK